MKDEKEKIYVSRNEVAKMLSLNPMTIYNWDKNGKLTSYKIGGSIRYLKSDVEALIQKRG